MSEQKILDFVKKKKQHIEEKRQGFERLMFKNILGAYTVIDQYGSISPIELVDISHNGCLFQEPWNSQKDERYKIDSEISLRMYFSEKSFIPVVLKIRYTLEVIGNDGRTYMRYGCKFNKELKSFTTIASFIDFLYKFAKYSTIDNHQRKVFFT
jgi:hypothetical protein